MDMREIPGDVARFILTKIDSVPHLEALTLLHADPAKAWSAQRVAERLYLAEPAASALLADLVRRGFVTRSEEDQPAFVYASPSEAQDSMVAKVTRFYTANVVAVSRLIHSKSEGRIQEFADAFRLKKD